MNIKNMAGFFNFLEKNLIARVRYVHLEEREEFRMSVEKERTNVLRGGYRFSNQCSDGHGYSRHAHHRYELHRLHEL